MWPIGNVIREAMKWQKHEYVTSFTYHISTNFIASHWRHSDTFVQIAMTNDEQLTIDDRALIKAGQNKLRVAAFQCRCNWRRATGLSGLVAIRV